MNPFDITAATNELKNIEAELKRIQHISKQLKDRKKTIEDKIQEYLTSHNHKGVMVNDVTIVSEAKTKTPALPKKEKQDKNK